MQSVLTADGTVASATSDMLIPLHMLGRPSFILENSLMLLMFQSIPCSIPNLSEADLKDTINATKSSRAVALDGCPPVTFSKNGQEKMARASTPTGRQGGVAIFAQQKYTLLPCACAPEVLSLYKNARWVHAAIPLAVIGANSKRFLHIISFCNLSGRDQGLIKTNRNRFLEKAFTHANRLGQQPVIICMDANTSIANSHCMSLAVAAGTWIDLGSHFSNGKPSPTSSSRKTRDKHSWGKHATRPDFIFANGPALSIIDSFQIRRDLAPKGHLGLEIIVNLDWVNNTLRMIKHPKCFPNQPSSSIEEQEATAAKVLLLSNGEKTLIKQSTILTVHGIYLHRLQKNICEPYMQGQNTLVREAATPPSDSDK